MGGAARGRGGLLMVGASAASHMSLYTRVASKKFQDADLHRVHFQVLVPEIIRQHASCTHLRQGAHATSLAG